MGVGAVNEQPNITRGFLFADLRGYTAFVEVHGDAAGASLLRSYRKLVRDAIGQFAGAEIRTEGDSFYVTFASASSAVAAALAIVSAAAQATAADPQQPIAVGIGVHAGETHSTDEGPVGSAVNIAARLAAQASAGEVLVTETVRGLTRTSGGVLYAARGTRRLKGIAEPVAVYAAKPVVDGAAAVAASGSRRLAPAQLGLLAGAIGVAILVVVGGYVLATGNSPAPSATMSPTAGAALPSASGAATAKPSATTSAPASPSTRPLEQNVATSRVPLAPGRYRAIHFRPAFEVTVDDGWVFRSDSADPGFIHLELADRPTSGLTFLNIQRLPTDPCAANPPASASDIPSFPNWLRAQPGLTVGADVPRLFGSVGAVQLDLSAHDEGACESGTPRYVEHQAARNVCDLLHGFPAKCGSGGARLRIQSE